MEFISAEISFLTVDNNIYRLKNDSNMDETSLNELICKSNHNCINSYRVNQIDRNIVAFLTKKGIYITQNIEESNLNVNLIANSDGTETDFQFHPKIKERALILKKSKYNNELLYTTNLLSKDATWDRLLDDVVQSSWGNINGLYYEDGQIYGIRSFADKSSESKRIKAFFTMDLDNNRKPIDKVQHAEVVATFSEFIIVAASDSTGNALLYVSNDNGINMRKAQFFPEKKTKSFNIIDVSNAAITLNVFHGDNEASGIAWGTTYISDSTGSRFKRILSHNRRYGDHIDFYKVSSLEGVFIANDVENKNDLDCISCADPIQCYSYCKYQSKVSFSRGNTWSPMLLAGCNNEKDTNCHVQLHIFSSANIQPLYSDVRAAGVIIGSGNTGKYLESEVKSMFISTDGGATWTDMKLHSPQKFVGITDRGGFFVFTDIDTKEISFSISSKVTPTTSIPLSQELRLKKIVTNEKDPSTSKVYILGEDSQRDDKTQTHLLSLDFSEFHTEFCKEYGEPNSDFEYFLPRSYKDGCLLGRKIWYGRKKFNSKCHPRKGYKLPEKRENCKCTYIDYMCDDGYIHKDILDPDLDAFECVPLGKGTPEKVIPTPCKVLYNETKGYVRVPGDSCVGGISQKLDPLLRTCPEKFNLFATLGILSFFTFLVLFGCILIYRGNPILQSWFESILVAKSNSTMMMQSGYNQLKEEFEPLDTYKDNENVSNDEFTDSEIVAEHVKGLQSEEQVDTQVDEQDGQVH